MKRGRRIYNTPIRPSPTMSRPFGLFLRRLLARLLRLCRGFLQAQARFVASVWHLDPSGLIPPFRPARRKAAVSRRDSRTHLAFHTADRWKELPLRASKLPGSPDLGNVRRGAAAELL